MMQYLQLLNWKFGGNGQEQIQPVLLLFIPELQMPQSTFNASSPLQTANAELSAQIVAALRDSEFIKASDESVAVTLLTMGNAKPGDWRRLLEKTLPATSTTIDTDHAAAHYAA